MNVSEAQLWMSYAKSDLDAAYVLLEKGDFFPRQICFFAQQVGEKAFNAILVFLGINFSKTRDLDHIRELIPEGWKVKEKFPQLCDLVNSTCKCNRRSMKLGKHFSWQSLFLVLYPQSCDKRFNKRANNKSQTFEDSQWLK